MKKSKQGFNTKLVHAGFHGDSTGAVNVPIYQTSTFAFKNVAHGAALFAGEEDGFIYTRIGNPTIRALEENIGELENGFGGVATSSGLSAVSTVFLSLLSNGDHMVGTGSVYGPSRGLVEKHMKRFGVESSFIDTSNLEKVKAAIKPNTKLVYIETPANPSMIVTDIAGTAKIAHEHNCLLVVDNTFASPYLQKPLDLGADIVLHSLTKFLNGHADIVGGVVIAKTKELYKVIHKGMIDFGCNMDPHQAFMVMRGIKTLSLRIDRAQQSAMVVANWLERHPKVEWVRYIGLPSHPQHELAKQQMSGFGTMIAFGLKGGLSAGRVVMDNVQLAALAVSLGGVESLIEHPASMTHASMSREDRLEAGITDGLVRYSVGIEDVEDIIADLDQALQKV